MSQHTVTKSGGLKAGRPLHNLPEADQFTPYFVPDRQSAANLYEDAVDITDAEFWLQEKAVGEFANLNLLHVLVAAYVRTVAVMPAINRFISGQRIYARNDISVIITAAKNESDRQSARFIKVSLSPSDTVYDVYRKIRSAVQQLKSGSAQPAYLPSETVLHLPRPFVKLNFWFLRMLDYFGKLPQSFVESSPYHGSLSISSLSVHGARPTYIGLGAFGDLPMTMSISTSQIQGRRAMSFRVTYDSRIADVYYFTEAFRFLKQLLHNPALLELPPERVFEDIF